MFHDDSTAEGQAISREDALIVHTRRNAFLFQENNSGSIAITRLFQRTRSKDIKPVMMVGGEILLNADTK